MTDIFQAASHKNPIKKFKYTAELTGYSWSRGQQADFNTIREALKWAEQYGTTADRCTIWSKTGRIVRQHVRCGFKWFRVNT